MNKKAQELIELLKERKLTIGSVESVTGGLFSSTMTKIPGASKCFMGAAITYTNDMKTVLVGVSPELIKNYGVISEPIAFQMAQSGRIKLGVDICVSFTGNAGPEAIDDLEVGLVYIGIAMQNDVNVYREIFNGDREEIQSKATEFALDKVLSLLRN